MSDKSPFKRQLIKAAESVDVYKKLKNADARKMSRVQKRSDQLDEAFDAVKLHRNMAYRDTGMPRHAYTPMSERTARAKRMKK
jgi:hypothetical protein